MMEEIEADTFAAKSQELRDREAELKMEIDFADRDRHEIIDLAVKAFELSQSLRERWVTADLSAKRKMLEIVCLNWRLDDVTLVPTMRKPFDLLIEGLPNKESREFRSWLELFQSGVADWKPEIVYVLNSLEPSFWDRKSLHPPVDTN